MRRLYFVSFIFLSFLLVGCSSQKEVAYFNKVGVNGPDSIIQVINKAHETRICTGDMLSISVTGLDPNAVAPFNLPIVAYATPGSDKLYGQPILQTYLVDIDGDINFPVIGTIRLVGLTKSQAISLIDAKLSPYLKNSIVSIQFMNYKITVLGEVARPGQYSINNERVTILEALGLAGDMTVFGKRNSVLVTRENNGKLTFARINFNSDEVFKSPYFYLQQNDVIYVEPNGVKSFESKNMSLYLSTITTAATVIAVLYSITR